MRDGWVLTKRFTLFCNFPPPKPYRVTHQPSCFLSRSSVGKMKRKAIDSGIAPKAKRQREPEADYCDVTPQKDCHGNAIWPASEQSIERAREFFKAW